MQGNGMLSYAERLQNLAFLSESDGLKDHQVGGNHPQGG